MANLFTTTPTGQFSDGGSPGITVATSLTFDAAGTVTGIRFYAHNNVVTSTVVVELWQVTSLDDSAPAGSLLASKSISGAGLTPNAYNTIALTTPVAVDTSHVYRSAVNITGGLYVATPNLFFSAPIINGHITGLQHRTAPFATLNNGVFAVAAAPGTYPSNGGTGGTAYFVDVDYTPSAAATLAANLTATASLAVPLATNPALAASLTATASLAVALSVPTTGPVDLIGTPVAEELLTCFTARLAELPNPPARIQLRVGQETGPLIGPNVDECCAGLAWIRITDIYPSWNSFPGPDYDWLPCGPLAYAVVLEMGMAFCMPWSASDDSFENMDPPNTQDWATAFATQMLHQTLMRQTAACCWRPTQRRAVGAWSPFPVDGGCTGGKLTVTVSVMAPCSDC